MMPWRNAPKQIIKMFFTIVLSVVLSIVLLSLFVDFTWTKYNNFNSLRLVRKGVEISEEDLSSICTNTLRKMKEEESGKSFEHLRNLSPVLTREGDIIYAKYNGSSQVIFNLLELNSSYDFNIRDDRVMDRFIIYVSESIKNIEKE